MTVNPSTNFDLRYQSHLKHLRLKGLQPKTIDAYARAIRRMGDYFEHRIDALTPEQLTDYFNKLLTTHSWSAVKHDLYGYKFFIQHVLGQPWQCPTSSARLRPSACPTSSPSSRRRRCSRPPAR